MLCALAKMLQKAAAAVRRRTRYLVKYRHKEGKVRGHVGRPMERFFCERSVVLDGFKLVRPQMFPLQKVSRINSVGSSQLKSKIKEQCQVVLKVTNDRICLELGLGLGPGEDESTANNNWGWNSVCSSARL